MNKCFKILNKKGSAATTACTGKSKHCHNGEQAGTGEHIDALAEAGAMGGSGKLVYLFELDSVRNSDEQMELAMKALFREIVVNGNAVAITFNQLIDSRFFLSLLNDEHWSDCVMKLFQLGAVRISQFGKFRTPSQYLISQALDSGEEFIFSGLPIRSCQKSLIALAKRSLMYSDMTELNEYISGRRSEEERSRLFREQMKDERGGVFIRESGLDGAEMMNTLRDLHAVLNLILQFSNIQNAYNPPKDFNAAREGLTLCDYIGYASGLSAPDIPEWDAALELVRRSLAEAENKNKRSDILKHIYAAYAASGETEEVFGACALAEAVVDLCYNYACEASITNVSKHYNVDELRSNAPRPTFSADFFARLEQYYGDAKRRREHFLTGESNDFRPYHFKRRWFCNLRRAVHLAEHAKLYERRDEAHPELYPYEHGLRGQRARQKGRILWGVGKKLCLTVFYLFVAFVIENYIYGFLEDTLDSYFETTLSASGHGVIVAIAASFLSAAAVEWASGGLSKLLSYRNDYTREAEDASERLKIDLPTFGDCLESFVSQLGDFVCALLSWRAPYRSRQNAALLRPVPLEAEKKINYVSKTVSDYKQYREGLPREREWMFAPSENIPLLDIRGEGEDVRLTHIEEMTGKAYGLVYRSPYHTLFVDPVLKRGGDSDNAVYSYERLAQSASQPGIVTVPVIRRGGEARFVLISQYRHAIRREQLCFPRGFGEDGLSVFENVQKELWEEIGAVLKDPATGGEIRYGGPGDPAGALTELGSVTADSGSLCSRAVVVQAELAEYSAQRGHEGILRGAELTADELREMIARGEIDDGFTLAAFSLWSLRGTE